jgi:hypothetical protein
MFKEPPVIMEKKLFRKLAMTCTFWQIFPASKEGWTLQKIDKWMEGSRNKIMRLS